LVKSELGNFVNEDYVKTKATVLLARPEFPKAGIVKMMIAYSEYYLLIYEDVFRLDIYKKNGVGYENHDLTDVFSKFQLEIKSIDLMRLPKLEWSDRYIDIVQLS